MKCCLTCGIEKPLEAFSPHAKCQQGRAPRCKECARIKVRERYKINPEPHRLQERLRKQLHSQRHRLKECRALIAQPIPKNTIPFKICPKCYIVQALTWFGKAQGRPDGLAVWCKSCCARSGKKWVAENKEHHRQLMQANYKAKREDYRRRYKKFKAQNPESIRQSYQRYAKKHPDKMHAKCALRRARIKGAIYAERVNRQTIVQRDKSICYLCGEQVAPHEITLDHVIPLARGGTHEASNLRVAHGSCNYRKQVRLLSELDWYHGPLKVTQTQYSIDK